MGCAVVAVRAIPRGATILRVDGVHRLGERGIRCPPDHLVADDNGTVGSGARAGAAVDCAIGIQPIAVLGLGAAAQWIGIASTTFLCGILLVAMLVTHKRSSSAGTVALQRFSTRITGCAAGS